MQNRAHIAIPALLITLAAFIESFSATVLGVDSLYYFFQRTVYLENLISEGSWWSNPARISPIIEPTLITANTGLLGGKYSLSTIRVVVPLFSRINAGIGVTGTSAAEGRSFSGSSQGAQFSSQFDFSVPSFEATMSYRPPLGGTIGGLIMAGSESFRSPGSAINNTYAFWGFDLGYLSPKLFQTLQFSYSSFSVYHGLDAIWDESGKIGMLITVNDGALLGSLEYGFSYSNGVSFFRNPDNFHGYETLKGVVSIRYRAIAGFLLGYSMDTPNFRDNGPTYHAGVELRRSHMYAFSGGYEIGVSPFGSRHNTSSATISLMHQIWIGYDFRKP